MKNTWTDQQLRDALQAELNALHCIKSAVYYEEGNPEKAIPYTILAGPHNDHASEPSRQNGEYGFTASMNEVFEV